MKVKTWFYKYSQRGLIPFPTLSPILTYFFYVSSVISFGVSFLFLFATVSRCTHTFLFLFSYTNYKLLYTFSCILFCPLNIFWKSARTGSQRSFSLVLQLPSTPLCVKLRHQFIPLCMVIRWCPLFLLLQIIFEWIILGTFSLIFGTIASGLGYGIKMPIC